LLRKSNFLQQTANLEKNTKTQYAFCSFQYLFLEINSMSLQSLYSSSFFVVSYLRYFSLFLLVIEGDFIPL